MHSRWQLAVTLLVATGATLVGLQVAEDTRGGQRAGAAPGVVIVAAGDIACDPDSPLYSGGTGTALACHQKATANLVAKIRPRALLTLGDMQYISWANGRYLVSYVPTWGRFKAITHPILGNHEGGEGGLNRPYFDYFGAAAGDRSKGYYSYNIGAWHLVALNSNCGEYVFNGSSTGCRPGSPQDRWLRADLASHRATCTLAYFHVPRFSSGAVHHSDARTDRTLTTLWQDLYAGGVDVVLNGHDHSYERFSPMAPDGKVDRARGIREFVVGTGGSDFHQFAATVRGSEVRNNNSFGVLKLTLSARSYTWRFVNDGSPGATNNDSGSASCHR